MKSFKYFIWRRINPLKKFHKYSLKNYKHIKRAKEIDALAKNDSLVKKVLKKITLKKAVFGTAVIGGASYGAIQVQNYLADNSGCFLKTDENICKVKELSCCNKLNYQVPFCSNKNNLNLIFDPDTCDNYDVQSEFCCEKCDCSHYNCSENQELICKTATVGEALSFFTRKIAEDSVGFLKKILTSTGILQFFLISFIVVIAAILFFKFI